jgi:uncharacterized SAM-binding protein YcdF (DUF218 family)
MEPLVAPEEPRHRGSPRRAIIELVPAADAALLTKILCEPLLISLILLIVGIAAGWRLQPVGPERRNFRRWLGLLTAVVLALAVVSTPMAGWLLRRSLTVPRGESGSPEYVVVLAGGYHAGTTPDLDALSSSTMTRVLFGVRYWKSHPSARLVMTGSQPGDGNPGRMTELMAEAAMFRGVPRGAIIRETAARNTREHPIRLRLLPGLTSASRLAVVTSDDHERRALVEFRRYFIHVDPQPVGDPELTRRRRVSDWFPQRDGLDSSTTAIQEWIGILWYEIVALSGSSVRLPTMQTVWRGHFGRVWEGFGRDPATFRRELPGPSQAEAAAPHSEVPDCAMKPRMFECRPVRRAKTVQELAT